MLNLVQCLGQSKTNKKNVVECNEKIIQLFVGLNRIGLKIVDNVINATFWHQHTNDLPSFGRFQSNHFHFVHRCCFMLLDLHFDALPNGKN